MPTLHHYIHCPFCVRVRLALGFLGIAWKSSVLRYDDEATPIGLTGKKMLPIVVFENGDVMDESLDIIRALDHKDRLGSASPIDAAFEALLSKLGGLIHPLCMPCWPETEEFDEEARRYFIEKKEAKYGPLEALAAKRDIYAHALTAELEKLDGCFKPFYQSKRLTILDILLASHLWGLHAVAGFRFPSGLRDYLRTVETECRPF